MARSSQHDASEIGLEKDQSSETRVVAGAEITAEAREKLLIADRLAAIGTLAAGAAHEINNPLTYALINVDHVLRKLRSLLADESQFAVDSEGPEALLPLIRSLTQAGEGLQRVRSIVRNL